MSAVARGGEMRTPVGGDRHSASVTPDFAQIHELWRFRLAPLPGYASQPDLRPMRRWDYPSNVADAAENAHANPAGNSIQLAPTGKGKKAKKAKRDVASAKGVGVAELKLAIPSTFAGSLASESGVGNALSPRQSNTLSLMRAVDSAVQRVSSRAGGSSMLSPTAHKFDVYADVFIPRYLKDIQTIPHRLTPLSPAPIFPPKAYIQEYSTPKRVEDAHKEAMSLALLTQAAPPTLPLVGEPSGFTTNPSPGQPPPLTPETYHARFAHLLRWELDAQATQKEDIVLWKVGVKVLNWDEDTFSLQVPNVRGDTEFGGRVAVGDLVHLREVVEIKEIRKNGREEKEYITGGCGTGRAFEGRITVVRKREASVYLYSPTLKEHIQIYTMPTDATTFTNGLPVFSSKDHLPYCFNVSFLLNGNPLCVMERGVWKVSSLLKLGGNANPSPPDRSVALNLARHWLFPKDVFIQNFPSSVQAEDIKATEWYDRGLNEEQRSAVKAIALGHSTAPYLIGGPPGTGKTKTVVEAVLQILRLQPAACILLCAPSNPATDTLAQRLSVHLKPSEMFRFNEPNRTFAEVPEEIGQYTYVENTRYALPPWKTFLKYRVVVTSCIDAAHLAVAQFTNLAWMELKEENLKAFDPHSEVKVKPHWTHLIIDEAAQGSEPVLSIPTSVVIVHPRFTQNASANDNHVTVPQLVLCGDPNQLGPMICSDDARASGLDISLLERLFKRALYIPKRRATISSLLEASSDSSATLSPSEASTSGSFKRSTNLVKNYRSHPVILMPPSAMFYNDTLQPCANNGMVAWAGLPVPHLPVKFIGHEYPEATKDEQATWYNLGEIRTVVATVKSMLANPVRSSPPLRPDQIGVMAPWREQVWKIREALRKEGLYDVDVGTVEDFQGREIRVVIISCVRSNSRFLEEDARKGLGMINDKKRMNVAITRARELLIVIGNGLILQTDAHWKKFLQFCIRNKLYTGPELDLGWDDGHISKLEVQLLNSDLDADDLQLLTSATRERF